MDANLPLCSPRRLPRWSEWELPLQRSSLIAIQYLRVRLVSNESVVSQKDTCMIGRRWVEGNRVAWWMACFLMGLLASCVEPQESVGQESRATGLIDPNSLHGKVMCGYQGWFRCPEDGTGEGWLHWSRAGDRMEAGTVTVEMWPDLSEFEDSVLYAVPQWKTRTGNTAKLFSSADSVIVRKHFDWMVTYGIDGVFVQRFLVNLQKPSFDKVLENVRSASQETGRLYAICYDLTGTPPNELVSRLIEDWKRLAVERGITKDQGYLHHNGRPVVFVWGLFDDRFDASIAHRLIDYFHDQADVRATIVGGCPWYWRQVKNPEWARAYRRLDVISPWNVGNVSVEGGIKTAATGSWQGDLEETRSVGVEFLPVIYPGFGWKNLKGAASGRDTIPRRRGHFYWEQFQKASELGCSMAYVAMFDEVDEATAVFKVSDDPPEQGSWETYEGLASDAYLRLTGEGTRLLRKQRSDSFPVLPSGATHP